MHTTPVTGDSARRKREIPKESPTSVSLFSILEPIGLYYEKAKKKQPDFLKFNHTPVFIWFMGIVFMVLGSYLIYHVGYGVKARLFDGLKEG